VRFLVLSAALAVLVGGAFGAGRPHATHAELPTHPAEPPRRPRPRSYPKRPPQFVVVSFDGSGGARLLRYWRRIGDATHARFTFFVSGVYLLDWAHHGRYDPPGFPRGTSAIGFAPSRRWVAAMRRELALAYRDGDEIGTHYNGHFCGPGGVGTWSAADWSRELAEFDSLLFHGAPALPFGRREIVGGRTPCLEGDLATLYPVLARAGFRYDASTQALLGAWPEKRSGIWTFPLLELPFTGHTFRVVGMDYNLMANQLDESPSQIESETYRTLWNAFLAEYRGHRAPLSIGYHFETWESWAYVHALRRFLSQACSRPAVRCTTYRQLAEWLDALPQRVLRRYRS
jgi:hypothetical protein